MTTPTTKTNQRKNEEKEIKKEPTNNKIKKERQNKLKKQKEQQTNQERDRQNK